MRAAAAPAGPIAPSPDKPGKSDSWGSAGSPDVASKLPPSPPSGFRLVVGGGAPKVKLDVSGASKKHQIYKLEVGDAAKKHRTLSLPQPKRLVLKIGGKGVCGNGGNPAGDKLAATSPKSKLKLKIKSSAVEQSAEQLRLALRRAAEFETYTWVRTGAACDACDAYGSWYRGRVADVRLEGEHVAALRVHYLGWSRRSDAGLAI